MQVKTNSHVNNDSTEALVHARILYSALDALVAKIDGERIRGTPLHPMGRMGPAWNEDYPAELSKAREVVQRFKRSYK
jgi:hypothetical protein